MIIGLVAELADAVDLKSTAPRACGFESRLSYHFNNAPIAQLGESACLISMRSKVQIPLGVPMPS